MKRSRTPTSEGLTQADIDSAIKKLDSYYRNLISENRSGEPYTPPVDDGKSFTIRLKPDPEGSNKKMREGRPIKIKTIFHSIELELEDRHGGKLTCEYQMRDTANTIADSLASVYPKFSKAEIEKMAEIEGQTFEETKSAIALNIAQKTFEIRLAVAKFFHDQLEPTLKVVLSDIIIDAELFGLAKYGYQLSESSQYERTQKEYAKLRKERVTIIAGRGRPKGSVSIDDAEFYGFLEKSLVYLGELEENNQRLTKHALARKLYPQNSNPLQQLNRSMKRYGISFENIIADYEKQKA